jgi:hypothetical protein
MVKVHTALLVVCAAALLACVALSLPLLTAVGPESPDGPPAAAATPRTSTEAPATRRGAVPSCLIGSWRVVGQEETIKFYIDDDPLPFTFGEGERSYEFHPDGQVVERNVDFTMVSSHRGQRVRMVRNGERIFTWSATGSAITYHSLAQTSLVVDFYDGRGRLDPATETPNRNFNETDDISCAATQVVETTDGYSSTWQRTGDYGVYG